MAQLGAPQVVQVVQPAVPVTLVSQPSTGSMVNHATQPVLVQAQQQVFTQQQRFPAASMAGQVGAVHATAATSAGSMGVPITPINPVLEPQLSSMASSDALSQRYNTLTAQLSSQSQAVQQIIASHQQIEQQHSQRMNDESGALRQRLGHLEQKVMAYEQQMRVLSQQMDHVLRLMQLQEKVLQQDRQIQAFIQYQKNMLESCQAPTHSSFNTVHGLQSANQQLLHQMQSVNMRPTLGAQGAQVHAPTYQVPVPGVQGQPVQAASVNGGELLQQQSLDDQWRVYGEDIQEYLVEKELLGPGVFEYDGFDADQDAKRLRKAMRGLGTNEKTLIEVITGRTRDQRQAIRQAFNQNYSRDLLKDIKSETSGDFRTALVCLLLEGGEADSKIVNKAIAGLGTNDTVLISVLCTRTNEEIQELKEAYPLMYKGKSLEQAVAGDTSGWYATLLKAILAADREVSPAVCLTVAREDARRLYEAGEARMGTDEQVFVEIFSTRSFQQLRATFDMYQKISDYDIEKSITRETSLDFKTALLTIVKAVRNCPRLFAELCHKATAGLGTDDLLLTYILTSRCEIDILDIAAEYRELYKEDLYSRIRRETRGDYRKTLVELFGDAEFDPEADCKRLRKAMRRFGTKESVLNRIIGGRTSFQKKTIVETFQEMYNRDLVKDVYSETSGDYRSLLVALLTDPVEFCAREVQRSVKGLGTDDRSLIEIVCTRSAAGMQVLNEKYQEMFSRSMADDVRSDTSGDYRSLLLALIEAKRNDNEPLDDKVAREEAGRLYKAGEERMGTDEAVFVEVFSSHSFAMLKMIFDHYAKLCDYDIEKSIKRETSLDFMKALTAIVKFVRDPQTLMAEQLYAAMKGAGTRDQNLIRLMVMHYESDLKDIADAFYAKYKTTLDKWIRGETSGDYRQVLLRLLEFSRSNHKRVTARRKAYSMRNQQQQRLYQQQYIQQQAGMAIAAPSLIHPPAAGAAMYPPTAPSGAMYPPQQGQVGMMMTQRADSPKTMAEMVADTDRDGQVGFDEMTMTSSPNVPSTTASGGYMSRKGSRTAVVTPATVVTQTMVPVASVATVVPGTIAQPALVHPPSSTATLMTLPVMAEQSL
eukprot:m.129541 g.129541  ORF g.129541 m.129541 type:complete len:1100 (-) comp13892_c0_seq1:527-3826(-)